MPAPKPTQAQPPSSAAAYLFLYNFASSLAWGAVLSRTIAYNLADGPEAVYPAVGKFTRLTQTVACMEILHSLLGIVRAPLFTTLMQVASRILLVWGVTYPFPELAASPAYTTMLLAWSVTEVIRYSYFGMNVAASPPDALVWLRYNTFFVLYPMGILSEVWLIVSATDLAGELWQPFEWALYAILAIYVPGSYVLYNHMIKQRKKVMRKLSEGAKKQQ